MKAVRHLKNKVRFQEREQVWNHCSQAWNQVVSQVWFRVNSQTWDQVWHQILEEVR